MADLRAEIFPTLILQTLAVASENQREIEELEGGGDEIKVEDDAYEEDITEEVVMGETKEDGNTKDSCPLNLNTSAVVNYKQRGTEKMEGGGKKGKTGSRFKRNTRRLEQKPNWA